MKFSALRMFVQMDLSLYGQIALRYVIAARKIVPDERLRLVSAGTGVNFSTSHYNEQSGITSPAALPPSERVWSRFQNLMLSPLVDPFVTLVCCNPDSWKRYHVAQFLEVRHRNGGDVHDTVERRSSGCVRNLLVATKEDLVSHAHLAADFNILPVAPDPAFAQFLQYE